MVYGLNFMVYMLYEDDNGRWYMGSILCFLLYIETALDQYGIGPQFYGLDAVVRLQQTDMVYSLNCVVYMLY